MISVASKALPGGYWSDTSSQSMEELAYRLMLNIIRRTSPVGGYASDTEVTSGTNSDQRYSFVLYNVF
jgi:hypothetical protein